MAFDGASAIKFLAKIFIALLIAMSWLSKTLVYFLQCYMSHSAFVEICKP